MPKAYIRENGNWKALEETEASTVEWCEQKLTVYVWKLSNKFKIPYREFAHTNRFNFKVE